MRWVCVCAGGGLVVFSALIGPHELGLCGGMLKWKRGRSQEGTKWFSFMVVEVLGYLVSQFGLQLKPKL